MYRVVQGEKRVDIFRGDTIGSYEKEISYEHVPNSV